MDIGKEFLYKKGDYILEWGAREVLDFLSLEVLRKRLNVTVSAMV